MSEHLSQSLPVIFGLGGTALTDEERSFFTQEKPFGFILFQRNCDSPDQLTALCRDLRDCVGWHCPILIDQEGGRVQRLKPPLWESLPAAKIIGDLYQHDEAVGLEAVTLQAQALHVMLSACGVDVNCAPCGDVAVAGETSDAIGDRSFSTNAEHVAALVKRFCEETAHCGTTPVLKHLPGHGRAREDSHYALPVIDAPLDTLFATDFKPFTDVMLDADKSNSVAAACWGMVAHLSFPHLDTEHASSTSSKIVEGLIRGQLGFGDAFVVTDDISMGALSAYGDSGARSIACLQAGIDCVVHCNGVFDDMKLCAQSLKAEGFELLSEDAQRRAAAWLKARDALKKTDKDLDLKEVVQRLNALLPQDNDFEEDEDPTAFRAQEKYEGLLLNLDGYEGPIDVLLNLARDQKVDLAKISVLALVQQYITFIDHARHLKIELAADYLVMAAWLAYLKSRLLLPEDDSKDGMEELSGPAMAEALAFQLKRLEAIQDASYALFERPRLGHDVFARGHLHVDEPNALADIVMNDPLAERTQNTTTAYKVDLYALLSAYGTIARRHTESVYEVKPFHLVSTDEAMQRICDMLGRPVSQQSQSMSSKEGWQLLASFLPEDLKDVLMARSAIASTFTAGLELVKQGEAEVRQDGLFKPIYFRKRHDDDTGEVSDTDDNMADIVPLKKSQDKEEE